LWTVQPFEALEEGEREGSKGGKLGKFSLGEIPEQTEGQGGVKAAGVQYWESQGGTKIKCLGTPHLLGVCVTGLKSKRV
jgi:hypothetical protein